MHAGRLLLSLCAVLTVVADAAPLPPDRAQALREQLKAHQQQTRTWSANFTQTLVMPGMRQAVVSTGRLTYREPAQLRLDFTQPAGEFVLVVGDRVYLQKAGASLEQLSLADDLAAKPFQALLGFLRGEATELELLYASQISRQAGSYLVVSTRRSDAPEELPRQIINTLDAESLEVRDVFVALPNGGTLEYDFDGVTRNHAIDGTRFIPPVSR